MSIKNKSRLDDWLFVRVQLLGHVCDGIKGAQGYNVAFIDRDTGETIEVEYE